MPPYPLSAWGMDKRSNNNQAGDDGFTHLSCSIINAHNPHVFPQGNPYFHSLNMPHAPVGYILEDINVPIQCVFPEDGGTDQSVMKDSEWSGCACLGDNPYQVPNESVWTCMMHSMVAY